MGKRGDEYLGHAVSNGRVNFWSVSSLEKGDPRSEGCPRRWAYRFVFGRKEPQNDYAKAGEAMHDQIKRYETGELPRERLDAEIVAALHTIPDPGPDLLTEMSIHHSHPGPPGAPWIIDWAPLTAAGIPVIGFIDLVHGRCTNKGASDILQAKDPPGTIEVIDWKRRGSKSSLQYIPEPNDLLTSIQMSGYGEFVRRAWPQTKHIRLSHVNVLAAPGTQPRAKKVTLRVLPEQCAKSWEYTEAAARTLVDVAKERDINRVPANLEACGRFGGCPHRSYCRASKVDSLSGLLGDAAAQDLANQLGGSNMGLVDNLNNGAPIPAPQMQQAPQYAPPAQMSAPMGPPPGVPLAAPPPQAYMAPPGAPPMQYAAPVVQAPAVQPPAPPQPVAAINMQAQLEAEERALAAQANTVPPEFIQAVKSIETSGRGFPMLQGRAAQLRATMAGMTLPPGAALSGGGEFGQHVQPIEDPTFVVQFARSLAPQAPAPMPAAQQYAPPQMPQPMQNPAPAGNNLHPLQNFTPSHGGAIGAIPPDAPASNPALASLPPQPVATAPATAPAEAAPKKRGRKKSSEAAPAAPSVAGASPAPSVPTTYQTTSSVAGDQTPTTAGAAADLEFFIDCIPLGDCESLRGYVDHICSTLARKYCVDEQGKPGLQDIRCAPKNSPLAYGGWKGALEAIVRELPPTAGGYLDTRGNEIAECVANALASVCEARGWLFVRGIR